MQIKTKGHYEFRVFVTCDGDCYGLLIEKTEPFNPVPKYAYFRREGDGGLAPTDEIKRICGENRYRLESFEKYKPGTHRYAQCRDQELIFLELLDYAKWAASNNYTWPEVVKKNMRIDYEVYDKKKYAGILSKFFSKEGLLRDFLVDLEIYTSHVLESPYGHDSVIGKAMEFSFRDPHNPLPEKNLVYLQDVEKLLKVKNSPTAEWFRSDGPLFSDFEDKRIYRRSVLNDLKKTVFEKPVYLLKGDVATGKSVIVRNLMYELFKEGYTRTYCFDVSGYRAFNRDILLREILSVTGIVIIENVHVEPEKTNWILSRIPADKERHLLFTSRKSIDTFRGLFNEEIHRVELTTLKAFDEADKIIDGFVSHPETSRAVPDKRAEILKVSKDNFWLLSFALLGCNEAEGKGEPIHWISDRVNKYLLSLGNLTEDKHCTEYSRIILALCPLYKNEVLTAEGYLTDKLHFPENALKTLARRGEITCQKNPEGDVFYGLPHSALAEAYWEHGKEYRRNLPECEDFIYDYAVHQTPNGLEAAVKQRGGTTVLHRLLQENKLIEVAEREQSESILISWCTRTVNSRFTNKGILSFIAKKILESDDLTSMFTQVFSYSFDESENASELWELLDHSGLANRFTELEDVSDAFFCLVAIYKADRKAGLQIWNLLNKNKLIHRLLQVDNVFTITEELRLIEYHVGGLGKELCSLIEMPILAGRLNSELDPEGVINSIRMIFITDKDSGTKLWSHVNKNDLAVKINGLKSPCSICSLFCLFCRSAGNKGKEFGPLIDQKGLIRKLDALSDTFEWVSCIRHLLEADKKIGTHVWKLIQKKNISAKEFMATLYYMEILGIYEISKKIGNEVVGLICDEEGNRQIRSLLSQAKPGS